MSNMRQIARLAEVSRTTVSRALRGDPCVTRQTREKVLEVARKLDYVPPSQQRHPFAEGRVIGYLIHEHFGVIATDILRGAAEEARQRKFGILMMQAPPDLAWIEEAIGTLLDLGISGLALAHSSQRPLPRRILLQLHSRGVHVVQVMNKVFTQTIDSSCRDERANARTVAVHLAQLGHRRVLGLGLHQRAAWTEECARQGMDIDLPAITHGPASTDGAFAAYLQMRPRPTACVCSKDSDAYRFMMQARLRGLSVPGDLSILGMGNFGKGWYPELTTLDLQAQEMGRAGIRLLARRIADGIPPHEIAEHEELVLAPHVLDRGSTGRA